MSQLPIRELLEKAWLDGYRMGVTAFAHWKDGQQIVGNCSMRLGDALRNIEDDEYAKAMFNSFLEKQRAKHEEKNDCQGPAL